jgi:antitoxin (DNA-binding transcriptional repressor) of toxin-antitoxin stability system
MIHQMKTATVRDLRTSFPRIEGWLAAGETVCIVKRRKVVAQLSPAPVARKPDFARRFAPEKKSAVGIGKSLVDLLIEERGP